MVDAALTFRVLRHIRDVDAAAWNALLTDDDAPVLRWQWLDALETSGSASAATGWEARHLTAWRGSRLVGFAPAWKKHHSMGEYVYDFGWAQAAQSLGVSYYPKFLVSVPLSPLTARRFVVAADEQGDAVWKGLVDLAWATALSEKCSSVHILFPPQAEALALEGSAPAPFRRRSMQYHWKNPGYATYDDFLSRFDSKRRHQLRREAGAAAKQGISLSTLRGQGALTQSHAGLAYRFYEATCEKNGWGQVQLNRRFFELAFSSMPEHLEMVLAKREGTVIAGAFNLATRKRLYGRYWGCFEEHPFLHFNVCLYHSIADCISLGREAFEPGAGGEHKISRGFTPTAIHSLHRIFNARLETAVRAFCAREALEVDGVVKEAESIAGMRAWVAPSPGSV